jgi:hypothetical protein
MKSILDREPLAGRENRTGLRRESVVWQTTTVLSTSKQLSMILRSTLEEVADAQKSNLLQLNVGQKRKQLEHLPELPSHALIISRVRRCW